MGSFVLIERTASSLTEGPRNVRRRRLSLFNFVLVVGVKTHQILVVAQCSLQLVEIRSGKRWRSSRNRTLGCAVSPAAFPEGLHHRGNPPQRFSGCGFVRSDECAPLVDWHGYTGDLLNNETAILIQSDDDGQLIDLQMPACPWFGGHELRLKSEAPQRRHPLGNALA